MAEHFMQLNSDKTETLISAQVPKVMDGLSSVFQLTDSSSEVQANCV